MGKGGHRLFVPASGSDKERSQKQNHKYGFLAHSERDWSSKKGNFRGLTSLNRQ